MCEFCGLGPCNVCGNGFDRLADLNAEIKTLRAEIAEGEAALLGKRRRLDELLVSAGRRPADGGDQPRLFEVAVQATLFS